jgi:hypothetical protein
MKQEDLDKFCNLKKEMPQAATWGGDPCHPPTFEGE